MHCQRLTANICAGWCQEILRAAQYVRGVTVSLTSVPTQSFVSLGEVVERLSSAPVLGDDWIGLCGPDEGLGIGVSVIDPFADGGLELSDVVKGAAPDALASNFSEQAFDEIEPGAGCRGKMQDR